VPLPISVKVPYTYMPTYNRSSKRS